MLDPASTLAIYMEGAVHGPAGKMGFGVLRYSQSHIACVIDSECAGQDLKALTGIDRECPIVGSIDEAIELGARVLVLGIAPTGGLIPAAWWPMVEHAVDRGLSIVNGLHDLVGPHFPNLATSPSGNFQFVWDIRIEPTGLAPGTGAAVHLRNKRVLLIGTDMAIGKMTAGLEIAKELTNKGVKTGFVATGQIGITITGAGIPLDAIRVDFASGAVEREVLMHSQAGADVVIVEGQGSLIHPGSTANLPLLRGSCPTHLILCHRAGQETLRHLPEIRIPDLKSFVRMYEDLAEACGAFPRPKTACVAMNTAHLNAVQADEACQKCSDELGIPCADPIRHGSQVLARSLIG